MQTVAVIDDHALVRAGIVRLVESQEHYCVVHEGDSLAPLFDGAVVCDVCLLDLRLHDRDVSVDDVRRLVSGGIHVLVVTALDSPRLARRIAFAGVDGLIAKSDPDTVLVDALDQLRRGIAPIDGLLATAILEDTESRPDMTPREMEVLELYAAGLTIRSVARGLSISEHTVKYHLREIRKKFSEKGLRASTQLDLARAADEVGLIEW